MKRSFGALMALVALAASAAACGAAQGAPDLSIEVLLVPADPGANLSAGVPVRVVAVVTNEGNASAGAFEVDLWADDGTNVTLLARHSLNVSGLAPGAAVTLNDTATFALNSAGSVFVHAVADPADRVGDADTSDNHRDVAFALPPPPAQRFIQDAGAKLSGSRTLPAYSFLAFRLEVVEGDSIIFQADAAHGQLFDCYLFNSANFTLYFDARERPNATGTIAFLQDYSRTRTDHIAFSTEPVAPGTYFLVIENDDRLQRGASPNGSVEVTFAVALVNNSIPPVALVVVIGAAAAAVWATVRWRPHFDVRSPLLEVDAPDPSAAEADPDEAEDTSPPEMDEGEGPPPHPP